MRVASGKNAGTILQKGENIMNRFVRGTHGSGRLLLATLALVLVIGIAPEAQASTDLIYDIQSSVDGSGGSTYVGDMVTISGTVTATYIDGYVVAEAPGPWQAIFVFSQTEGPDIGDEVEVTGIVDEYYGMTVIGYVISAEHLSSGNAVVATPVTLAEANQEQYESVLVSVADVTVAMVLDYGEWIVIDDSPDYAVCDVLSDYVYFPQPGDNMDSVTGILFYAYGAFKIEPRFTNDIVGDVIPHYALRGHVVTMNDSRDVLRSAYVEVLGDEIVSIQRKRPKGIPVVQAGGLIFPGLIDSHNHPSYNVLGFIPFQKLFEDRYEWRDEQVYDDFGDQLSSIEHYDGYYAQYVNLWKLAEVRALTAGTTAIQGSNCNGYWNNDFAHQGIGINNVERFPARVYHTTFPLWLSPADWAELNALALDRFIIHLCEGINSWALDEFYIWQGAGMLDGRTTIIHGVPLGDPEWAAMAAVGANLIWSPMSNLVLYGDTADVPGALAAGVNVALAPDWTESGSKHILDEMRVADAHDNAHWGDVISPLQLAEFVTRNAAKAVGTEQFMGQIAPGYRANLMVIPGSPKHPYDALLRATQKKVKLTVVDGKPMYGNPDTVASFGFAENVESITVGGEEKALAIQVDVPYAHIPEADKPFSQVMSELEEAYAASEPKVCEFLGIE
jgi:5-methylthioadenosine/S-adenosylhomocysteine deaminase